MQIAVPVVSDRINQHFGQTRSFRVFTVEGNPPAVGATRDISCGEGGCHLLGQILKSHGVEVALVGGIGEGALRQLEAAGLTVVSGVTAQTPLQAVEQYLSHELPLNSSATCRSHSHGGHGHQHGHGHGHGQGQGGCHCHQGQNSPATSQA